MAYDRYYTDTRAISTDQRMPAGYQWSLVALVFFFGLLLLTIVDFRRGFLFAEYMAKTPFFAFNPLHLLMLALGLAGLVFIYKLLRHYEARLAGERLDGYVLALAFALLGLLVVDLFVYRGVAAARAITSGELSAGWLEAFGATGWVRPVALAASYALTVWHATLLGVLLAGLALTVLPRYLKSFFARGGWGGSLFGATFALPQPFCSCCASVIAPSFVRRGASTSFSLAFVVGAPMLNITSLILAATLLPAPYALTRVLAGVLLTVPITYGVAWLADKRTKHPEEALPGMGLVGQWVSHWGNLYSRLFHLEEIVRERRADTPGTFLASWLFAASRIALLLVPMLLVLSTITAAVIQLLPGVFGNNALSVVVAALVGTLLMVSTWTEIPVAQQMILAGYHGPAATLLVVLPPVSLPALMVLGGSLGSFRAVAFLGLAVAVAGIVAGVAFL